jgi:hypothetical protein
VGPPTGGYNSRGTSKQTAQVQWSRPPINLTSALLAGLRAQELRDANVADLRVTQDGGAVLHVGGKGNKDRTVDLSWRHQYELGICCP